MKTSLSSSNNTPKQHLIPGIFHYRVGVITANMMEVEQLDQAAIYFHNQGMIHLKRGTAKIIKTISLAHLHDKLTELNENAKKYEVKNEFKHGIWASTIDKEKIEWGAEIRESLNATQMELDILYEMMGTKRNRRGLIDGFGSGFKYLFGTMDNNDAEDIRKHLDGLDNNEKNLDERSKQVWKIVEKLNEGEKLSRDKQKEEIDKINILVERFNDIDRKEVGMINEVTLRDGYSLFKSVIRQISREIVATRYALQFAQVGILDPFLLKGEELAQSMNTANLGYHVDSIDAHEVIRKINKTIITNKDKMEIHLILFVPTTKRNTALWYNMIPIPRVLAEKRMQVVLRYDVMIINKENDEYWIGSNIESTSFGNITISQIHLMMKMKENASCETNVYMYKNDLMCEYEEIREMDEIQKVTNDGYLIISYNTTDIKYDCVNKNGSMSITGAALIKINENCTVEGNNFEITRDIVGLEVRLKDFVGRIQEVNYTRNLEESIDSRVEINKLEQIENWMDLSKLIKDAEKWIEEHPLESITITVGTGLSLTTVILVVLATWAIPKARIRKGLKNMEMKREGSE